MKEDEKHLELPVGEMISGPLKGDFQAMPVVSWIGVREIKATPLVMVAAVLLPLDNVEFIQGTILLEIPVTSTNESDVCRFLESVGWSGKLWPGDAVDADTVDTLHSLSEQFSLRKTLVFDAEDPSLFKVTVQRPRGPFLMPAIPTADVPPQDTTLQKFREILLNPTQFVSMVLN